MNKKELKALFVYQVIQFLNEGKTIRQIAEALDRQYFFVKMELSNHGIKKADFLNKWNFIQWADDGGIGIKKALV